jgi:hypothetical protein
MVKQYEPIELVGKSVLERYLVALNASDLMFVDRERHEAQDGVAPAEDNGVRGSEPAWPRCLAFDRRQPTNKNLSRAAALSIALLVAVLLIGGAFAVLSRSCKTGSQFWCVQGSAVFFPARAEIGLI